MLAHPYKNKKNVGKMLNPVGEQPNNAFNARRAASQRRHEHRRSAFRGLSEQLTDRTRNTQRALLEPLICDQ